MKVRILPSSNQHYVGNMQQSPGSLTWDSAGIGWTLMVRSDYGEPIGIDDAIMGQLQRIWGTSLVGGPVEPIDLPDGRSIALLRFNPMMGGINAYSYSISHAHYAIFGCVYESESDVLTVYESNSFVATQCDVPGTVKVCIRKHSERQGGWFGRRKDVFLGYSVSIEYDGKLSDGEDWGLQYKFAPSGSSGGPFCYPIVPNMVGKEFLVRALPEQEPPKIESSKKGYVVEVTADL